MHIDLRSSFKIFPDSLFSEKQKTVLSFELHFLQNCLLLQAYTSVGNRKVLKVFLEVIFKSLFSFSFAFLTMAVE